MELADCHIHYPLHWNPSGRTVFLNSIKASQWKELTLLDQPGLTAFLGLHPWFPAEKEYLELLDQMLYDYPRLGIGEVGLDYGPKGIPRDQQLLIFHECCRLALHYERPMVLHMHRSWQDLLSNSKSLALKIPVMVHGFTGSPELAGQLSAKGFYLSLGPAGQRKGLDWLSKVIENTAKDRILAESDYDGNPEIRYSEYARLLEDLYRALAEASAEPLEWWGNKIERNASVFTNGADDRP